MIDSFECCELAAHLSGIEDFEDEDDVWGKLWVDHEIDQDGFCWLINKLVPMMNVGESPISHKMNIGFSKKLGDGIIESIIKKELENSEIFKRQIAIRWIFEEMKDREKGFEMDLTGSDGKLKLSVEKVD